MRTQPETIRRFMAFIEKDENGCWLWRGHCNDAGYGTFRDGKMWLAHRWAYQFIAERELPLELHHRCRIRRCANPEHVTPTDPDKHPDKPSVLNLLKESCPKGHLYTGDNLYIDPLGHRHCRECRRAIAMRSYFRHWSKNRAAQSAYYQKNKITINARKRK